MAKKTMIRSAALRFTGHTTGDQVLIPLKGGTIESALDQPLLSEEALVFFNRMREGACIAGDT